jgi:hypothetical protein
MPDSTEAKRNIEKAVAQVLDREMAQVREALVEQVLQHLPDAVEDAAPAGNTADLVKAVSAIHASSTQREILRTLLDNSARYCGRTALFVVKNGAATGWQSRGFSAGDDDPVKDFSLEIRNGLAERAMQSRKPFAGPTKDMDSEFNARFGASASDEVMVLPLVLKEKVAALLYADAGQESEFDSDALELLVLSTSAWLEVTSLRKQSGPAQESAPAERTDPAPMAKAAAAVSDPFAGHAPSHSMRAPEPVAPSVPAQAPDGGPVSAVGSGEDSDVHRKAQRFARLLVDEIKLYNQAKVTDGRKHKDLYDRLKEDIEKSRATYHKRYGNTAAGSVDYFSQELVRSLAEDDASIMGANFRR